MGIVQTESTGGPIVGTDFTGEPPTGDSFTGEQPSGAKATGGLDNGTATTMPLTSELLADKTLADNSIDAQHERLVLFGMWVAAIVSGFLIGFIVGRYI